MVAVEGVCRDVQKQWCKALVVVMLLLMLLVMLVLAEAEGASKWKQMSLNVVVRG